MQLQRVAYGPLNLTPSEFWELTPAEFRLLVEGYEERERLETIKRAELIAEMYNSGGFAKRKVTVRDVLPRAPWVEKYLGSGNGSGDYGYCDYTDDGYDDGEGPKESPALIAVKELLEAQGFDPEELDRKSDEWQAAEREVLKMSAPGPVVYDKNKKVEMSWPEDRGERAW